MEWISNWAEGIIIAVIIATIIELILPDGSSKKYIKVVIGVYVLFTIISPVITKFSGKSVNVSDIIDLNQYIKEVEEKENSKNLLQENNSSSIREIYIGNLKADIQNKLKGKGYIVTSISLDVGYDDNYTLHKITLSANKQEEDNNKEQDSNNSPIHVVNEINILLSNTDFKSNSISDEEEKSNLSNSDKKNIREYLSSVYYISDIYIE